MPFMQHTSPGFRLSKKGRPLINGWA